MWCRKSPIATQNTLEMLTLENTVLIWRILIRKWISPALCDPQGHPKWIPYFLPTSESENEVGLTISDMVSSLPGFVVFWRGFPQLGNTQFSGHLRYLRGRSECEKSKVYNIPRSDEKHFFIMEKIYFQQKKLKILKKSQWRKNIFHKKYFRKYFFENIFCSKYFFSMMKNIFTRFF